MSASSVSSPGRSVLRGTSDPCRVVLLCEDSLARARALRVCERLLERFGEDLDFEFNWWKLSRLEDAAIAQRATHAAAMADIVMVCTHSGDLPPETADCLETWAESGVKRDGALALVSAEAPTPLAELTISRMEQAAQLLGKDFIRMTPEDSPRAAPEEGKDAFPYLYESDAPETHLGPWGPNA